jgi:hypothetical protein
MILEHLRFRRSATLLATGALRGEEEGAARAHMARCPRCRARHDEVVAFMARLGEDPARGAEPDVTLPVLVAQVNARLDQALKGPKSTGGWRLVALPAAAVAAVAAWFLVPPVVDYFRPASDPARPAAAVAAWAPVVSEGALLRLERNVAREQAALYLAEAQDVLVNVASSPRDCERTEPPAREARVDLDAESRRSRELLARRALLVEADEAAVLPARPVLDDVDEMLREVATLESCARARDLSRLREQMDKRNLLMKMRLMQRELAG